MLEREEYIEQAHLFRVLGERLGENVPIQELLLQVREEILATTKLPMAIDFLLAELKHAGQFSSAMRRLGHYFAPFQSYVVTEAESDRSRFDFRVAVDILRFEAEYRASERFTTQGLFLYQFETLSRNRLRYDPGLDAMSHDPAYDESWREWILNVRRQVGIIDFADLLFVRSDHYQTRRTLPGQSPPAPDRPMLFGEKEGRIAFANRRKDPLYLFAALQRQLGYPAVPRPRKRDELPELLPQLARRLERLEVRLKLLEEEQRSGAIDLSKFYSKDSLPWDTAGDPRDSAAGPPPPAVS